MNINASGNRWTERRVVCFQSKLVSLPVKHSAIWFQPMPVIIGDPGASDGEPIWFTPNRFGYEQNHLRISYADLVY